jgi:two-component system, NtrC family, sensor kinase
LGNGITVDRQFGTLPKIQCFPAQLNQVFMHLINNAIDALDDRQQQAPDLQAKITITTRVVDADRVELQISDNGVGIPADITGQIFNPFFSTKSVDTGKGLGLSICYRVVQAHCGTIEICSVSGSATTVTVQLPMLQPGFN